MRAHPLGRDSRRGKAMTEPGFKEYEISGVVVEAKKSPGGGFYEVIMPDGERLRYIAEVFETVARVHENR